MAILPHSITLPGGGEVTIYGETANINYFINGDLEPDTIDGPVNAQVSVGSSSRRQYPGDATTINVAGTQREFLKDPSRSSGSALPGKNFVLKEIGGPQKRQFTYTGDFMDLHAFIRAEAAMDLYLYNNTGARYTITETQVP
jgi:hypothetical protein